VPGWAALLAGVGAALLTVSARLLHGADLPWLVRFFISAAAYVLLAGRPVRCDS